MKRAFRTYLVFASVLAWLFASVPASRASQGSCVIPTVGLLPGLTLVNDINACNSALLSLYSGATAPASPTTGMLWYNTTTNYIQQYDGLSWLNLWYVDATNHLTTHAIGGGLTSATLASAATTDIGSVPQSVVTVTGTTSITSLGSSAQTGTVHVVIFAGATTLTYNATSMIIPGQANKTTAAGDIAFALYLGSGNWRILDYVPISGAAIVGNLSVTGFGLFGSGININGGVGTAAGGIWSQANYGTIFSAGRASPSSFQFAFFDSTIGTNFGGFDANGEFVATGAVRTPASSTSKASLRVPTGVAPTSPVDGDIWNDGSSANIRVGSTTLAFGVNFATKSDQQTGTSGNKAVTPLHQQDHASATKAWVYVLNTLAIQSSYNVSGVTRPGTGNYTINFTTPFTSVPSCVVSSVDGGLIAASQILSVATGSVSVFFRNISTTAAADPAGLTVHCNGAQ
jgi:hypothetical protein